MTIQTLVVLRVGFNETLVEDLEKYLKFGDQRFQHSVHSLQNLKLDSTGCTLISSSEDPKACDRNLSGN